MWFNPIMIWLLKSPLHGAISKNVMLTTVTGRKSGKQISIPTNYLRDGNALWIITWRDRNWWKNFRGGAKAQILLAGKVHEGYGQVIEVHQAVAQSLFEYYSKVPKLAKYSKIGLDAAGKPIFADCEHAAERLVMVRIDLQ